jgi:hypothetical protein
MPAPRTTGGFDDPPAETGVPFFSGSPTGTILEPMNPGWKIGVSSDAAYGSFTENDGITTLIIPAASDWVLTAAWDLPDPNAIEGKDSYFYIGFDVTGIDQEKFRIGTEWKRADGSPPEAPKQWWVRDQAAQGDVALPVTTSHVAVRQTCIRGGDPNWIGGDAVYEEYSLDYGPWQPLNTVYGYDYIPLDPLGKSGQPHYITFKVRGLGGIIDPTIAGPLVPDVNTGNDHDGDTVVDEIDPWPGNGDWSTDSDADHLADEWEMEHFENLDETPSGNPDGDDFTNIEEMLNGTDPLFFNEVPAMSYVGVLALLALVVVMAGRRVSCRVRA